MLLRNVIALSWWKKEMPFVTDVSHIKPNRHKTLNQCWFNVGPPSTTLDQR